MRYLTFKDFSETLAVTFVIIIALYLAFNVVYFFYNINNTKNIGNVFPRITTEQFKTINNETALEGTAVEVIEPIRLVKTKTGWDVL